MTERINYASGSPWEPLRGFSRAVRIGNALYISGTTAQVASGDIIGGSSSYEQTRFALDQVKRILVGAGFKLADVVRTRLMVTNLADFAGYARAHQEVFESIRPASSIVQVVRLVDPRLLVEVEVEAVKGATSCSAERLSLLDGIGAKAPSKGTLPLSLDKNGKPVSKRAIEAFVRILIELSGADNDIASAEAGTIVDVLLAHFHENESLIPALVESALERAKVGSTMDEVFQLLNETYSEAQRLILLGVCWRLVLSDGRIAPDEIRFADELRAHFGLSEQQEAEARRLARDGEI